MAKKTNVIKLPQNNEGLTETYVNAFAALRAVDVLHTKLAAQMDAAAKEWRVKLSDATKEYRAPIRDETVTVVAGVDLNAGAGKKLVPIYAAKFVDVVKGVKKHDDIKLESEADIKERKERIGRVDATVRECIGASTTAQTELFATKTGGVLPWATTQAKQVIFTAMQGIENDGGMLDPIQSALYAALGGDGVEALDLGVQASVAVEADDAAEEELESTEEDASVDLGF